MSEPSAKGRRYWRSLEERANAPEFREMLEREFPQLASEWNRSFDRRKFLTLMGASMSLAGLACTRQPTEYIAPYVNQPESLVPGNPLLYATAMTLGGYATGLLVESHEFRPTKVEGNPEHPASLGATDALAQASILGLYDPDRSQTTRYRGEIRPWSAFVATLPALMETQKSLRGAGLRILTGTVTSPTLAAQLELLLGMYPEARWHQYEPSGGDNRRRGARLAFGRDVSTRYDFRQADVILTLDADFLAGGPGHLRYVRDFTARRAPGEGMNRLYALESTPTLTGAKADRRLPLKPSAIQGVAASIASRCGVSVDGADAHGHEAWIDALSRDLLAHGGRSLVVAGEEQPAGVHALAHALNAALGNTGKTVIYSEPVEARPEDQQRALADLVASMNGGQVDALFILGGNPVYDTPGDVDFAAALEKVRLRVHLGLHDNETAARCDWHIPQSHYLESWSDARAYDGTVSIVQPLIAPLYASHTAHDVLSALLESPGRSSHAVVKDHWRANPPAGGGSFDVFWKTTLHDGLIRGSALPAIRPSLRADWNRDAHKIASAELELVVRTDPSVFDGSFSNNGWLQELPKPLSKLTWDNAAMMNPATAASLGLTTRFSSTGGEHGEVFCDVVELEAAGRKVEAPLWILPGAPDGTVTVHLGYGRGRGGQLAVDAGFDAYRLQALDARWTSAVTARKTGETMSLANTQGHWSMEGRDLVRSGTLADFLHDPSLAPHGFHELPEMSMYEGHEYNGYAWGMSIDLNNCVGCNACIVACQSENNIPVVGKEQVAAGREMHWLRVDRYYEGDPANPESIEAVFQPVPCMHCENAPCEVVCPVAATVHSAEGLNDMVYNRCIGTRYCSNNCPYKVRRFNFFLYQDFETESLKLARNPDVTIRSRGVMEKCTYCVQRINRAKIEAEIDGRKVLDGDLQTACQQACPARAIHFGDINNPDSVVAQARAGERNYGLLPELNTRPRTTYMGTVRNSGAGRSHEDGGQGDAHDEESHG